MIRCHEVLKVDQLNNQSNPLILPILGMLKRWRNSVNGGIENHIKTKLRPVSITLSAAESSALAILSTLGELPVYMNFRISLKTSCVKSLISTRPCGVVINMALRVGRWGPKAKGGALRVGPWGWGPEGGGLEGGALRVGPLSGAFGTWREKPTVRIITTCCGL